MWKISVWLVPFWVVTKTMIFFPVLTPQPATTGPLIMFPLRTQKHLYSNTERKYNYKAQKNTYFIDVNFFPRASELDNVITVLHGNGLSNQDCILAHSILGYSQLQNTGEENKKQHWPESQRKNIQASN